jgi:hypothetical protein
MEFRELSTEEMVFIQIEHTRHRSLWNFLGNVAAGLIAYTWHEKKPSLNIRVKEPFLISN